jgi:hypothetical protein
MAQEKSSLFVLLDGAITALGSISPEEPPEFSKLRKCSEARF